VSTGGVDEAGSGPTDERPRAGSPIEGAEGPGVSPSAWEQRPPPESESALVIGRWGPAGLADLTVDRRRLSAALRDSSRPPGADDDAVDRLLLAYQELTSNALRHGRWPVGVTVSVTGTGWLLEVSDAAADRPPRPAFGRDPGLGGLGLRMVAETCDAYGWDTDGARKIVWARIDSGDDDIGS
jgi:anti-sigma regulatory factor (Ser/Thr protein kinase)